MKLQDLPLLQGEFRAQPHASVTYVDAFGGFQTVYKALRLSFTIFILDRFVKRGAVTFSVLSVIFHIKSI